MTLKETEALARDGRPVFMAALGEHAVSVFAVLLFRGFLARCRCGGVYSVNGGAWARHVAAAHPSPIIKPRPGDLLVPR